MELEKIRNFSDNELITEEKKAAEQAALFSTKQVDPGAPTYSLDFLRRHPEISTESVPWHMHAEPQHPVTATGGGSSK